ncbi:unnamed protein product [Prorocentrum cordatum]|uniref:Eukaryotic translation initiation factor 3 subunit E N-terminal domain-containing protein n=1 Tax=Prorocentrum cordatum TaxID=2364126 RepID=A0ABN9QUK4_9DINO|nr:unnamed protein product [Polarella glacialis]
MEQSWVEAEAPTCPEAASPDDAAELARYDLCSKISPFLDRHLILPILIFVKDLDVYKVDDITRAEIKLLEDTNMIDFIVDKYPLIGEEAPAALMERREGLLASLEASRERIFKLLQILEDDEEVKRIPGFKSLGEFYTQFELDEKVLDDLLQYTKLMYECGDYGLCVELLKHYKTILAVDTERPVNKDTISMLWGQLASNILTKDFKVAAELILDIHDKLEKAEKAENAAQKMPMREVLLQRTWLLHWALYAVFNSEEVDPKVLDFFLNEKSLSIISLSCPYLFRYVGACLILNKRLKLVPPLWAALGPAARVWQLQRSDHTLLVGPVHRHGLRRGFALASQRLGLWLTARLLLECAVGGVRGECSAPDLRAVLPDPRGASTSR